MALSALKRKPEKIWRSGEMDADPFHLPQDIRLPANRLAERMLGFITFARIGLDGVTARDSSPLLGLFEWTEPLSAYKGVVMRVASRKGRQAPPAILVELLHESDASRSLVLHVSFDGSDVAARWRSWGRVLNLPLLLEDREGALRDAERRLGALLIDTPQPHMRANPLTFRRPLTFGFTGRGRGCPPHMLRMGRPGAYRVSAS